MRQRTPAPAVDRHITVQRRGTRFEAILHLGGECERYFAEDAELAYNRAANVAREKLTKAAIRKSEPIPG